MIINWKNKEINCKIVYYGPGLSGKTTNIKYLHENIKEGSKGELTTIATETERTLYFDFTPISVKAGPFNVKFLLYTTPGQIIYSTARSLILKGVDGIVFVADSQEERHDANIETMEDMLANLENYGIKLIEDVPLVIQYNKRDMPSALPVEVLRQDLNVWNVPDFEAIAVKGVGVVETFKEIMKLTLEQVQKKTRGGR